MSVKVKIKTELPGPKTKEYIELKKKYEPNSMSDQVPVVWRKGERVYIEDVDGNVFLDFSSGVLVTNAGHSHPKIVEAIKEEAEMLTNTYDFMNEYRSKLAKKLVEITPDNLDKAFLLTTGSEATEAAMKLARKYTGRKEIISFQGGFHGRTYGAMSAGGKRSGAGTKGFGPFLPGFIQAPYGNCYRCVFGKKFPECDYHCIKYLDTVVETSTERDIAAVITEPYQGGAGSIIPPKGWLKKLEEWCKKNDILLIVDEVQSSFGRTGKMFCFEHEGIKPNLLCLGKGITSSVPLSALVGESRIMDVLTPGSLSSTHGGNALCSRAALVNIEIIEKENLVENSRVIGEYMLKEFKKMEEKYEVLGDARGQGLVLGLEIVKDKEKKTPAPDIAKTIVRKCYEKGLILIAPIGYYGNVIRIAPALVITQEEAEFGLKIFEEVFKEICR